MDAPSKRAKTNDSVEPSLPLIRALFPELSEEQFAVLGRLSALTKDSNNRVNLLSRKDAENLEERHILMSLLMGRCWQPAAGHRCMDLGTGGGFPGIPLAVMYPKTQFVLVDSIAKKTKAVQDVVDALHLPNVSVITSRAEKLQPKQFDAVIGRAVTALPEFLRWSGPLLKDSGSVVYFKGTRWQEELEGSACRPALVHDLFSMSGSRPFFEGKFVLIFRAPVVIEDHIKHDTNKNMHAKSGDDNVNRKKKKESKNKK